MVAVTLTDWSGSALTERCPLPVTTVSLITGEWNWSPIPDAPVPVMPACNVTARGKVAITDKQNWGRLGMDETRADIGHKVHVLAGEKCWSLVPVSLSGNLSYWLRGWNMPGLTSNLAR